MGTEEAQVEVIDLTRMRIFHLGEKIEEPLRSVTERLVDTVAKSTLLIR